MSDLAAAPGPPSDVPLIIDLDGTLVRADLLHESLVQLVARQPAILFSLPGWLLKGKAFFKSQVASRVEVEADSLPYQAELVQWIRAERARGRQVTLCTASDMRIAQSVAETSKLFDKVLGSNGVINMSAHDKAAALVERHGRGGFDYAGNSHHDVPVWEAARAAIVVNAGAAVRAAAGRVARIEQEFARPSGLAHAWLKALRMPQWVKNLLVFLPLLGAHAFNDRQAAVAVALAFIAFCLCASAVYLVNDIVDVNSDRRHPRKRNRPFASGALPIPHGLAASAILLAAAFGVALVGVNLEFVGWLLLYLVTTACYSLWLKRKVLVDSLVLAGLYTMRVLAGGAAASIAPGFWLLAFSLFLFFSLALVKRYSELKETFLRGHSRTPGRDYVVEDLSLVETLGIASGFSAVLVLALYINGDTVTRLYKHQEIIWMTVPVLLYWVSRIWLKAHRGELADDPVVFALTDGLSQALIALFFMALLLATIN